MIGDITRSTHIAPMTDCDAVPARRKPRTGYHCGTCGAVFATQRRLNAHLERAYHGFQCLACGAVSATRPAFDAHIRLVHRTTGIK